MADQSIALGVRAPSIPNLGGIAAQNMNIMNQMIGMKRAQQEEATQNYLRQAGGSLNLSDPQAVQQFMAQGGPQAAQFVQGAQQAQSNQINLQDKQHAQGVKLLGGAFRSILNDPSDANLDAVSQTLIQAKVPPEMIEQELGAIRRLPVEQRAAAMEQVIMSDPQSLEIFKLTQPKPQQFNLGGKIVVRDMNPLSPTFQQPLSEDAVTMTPYQKWQTENPTLVIKEGEGGFYGINPRTNQATPTTIGSGTPTGRAGTVSVESLRPAVIAQESGGDYTARNSSTGALGAYQIMPATGRALAERLGIQWMPGLMTKNTPEARKYQDAIGTAALEEAVAASGGDPMVAAAYYHGGSDRNKWGPKTQKYAQEVTGRMGGAAPATAGMGSAPGQQLKPKPTATQVKQDEKASKAQETAHIVTDKIDRQISRVEQLLNDPNFDSLFGSWRGLVPGEVLGLTDQGTADAYALFDSIKGGATINELHDLKASGGSLGQVSNYEDKMLGNAAAVFNRQQSPGAARSSLNAYLAQLKKSRANIDGAYQKDYGDVTPAPRKPAPAAKPSKTKGGARVSNW